MSLVQEPTNVGLTERGHLKLKRLKEDRHFLEMSDAYRFGIALALAHGVVPEEAIGARTTIFGTKTIDPEGEIATAIRAVIDNPAIPIYKMAERLAEWGIDELSRRAESGDLDLPAILLEASNQLGGV